VVSTPVAGMRGLPGVLVVPDFTPQALAGGIRELLQDPRRRADLGAAGARHVREHLSAAAMVEAYARRYVAIAPTIF
jgi:glycosyltransferase involved in cell wall biosynthesis